MEQQREKTYNVPQPLLIDKVNKYTRGVNHLNLLTQKYQIVMRGKKWYLNWCTNSGNIAEVNVWIISTIVSGAQTSLLGFSCSIVRYYLQIPTPLKPKHPERVKEMLQYVYVLMIQHTDLTEQKEENQENVHIIRKK